MIKVMLVDDHKMFREGISIILGRTEDIRVVDEVGTGSECLKIMSTRSLRPDIIILDIHMPELDGIQTLQMLRRKRFRTKVLILTSSYELDDLVRAVDYGTDGYLVKSCDSNELLRAIRYIMNGHKFVQPSLIPLLNSKLIARDLDEDKIVKLSEREIEVLKEVALGMYNKEIGEKLGISDRTVKNHLTNIFKKIECSDRTQAAIFAIRNEMITMQ